VLLLRYSNTLLLLFSLADISLYLMRYLKKVLMRYILKKFSVSLVLHVYPHEVAEPVNVRNYTLDYLC
jgi:hypothetical protein